MGGFTEALAVTLVFVGILALGLIVAGIGLVSIRRDRTRTEPTDASDEGRALTRLAAFSLGAGAVVFGVVGLIARHGFARDVEQSVLWALAAGILTAFLIQVILYPLTGRRLPDLSFASPDAAGRLAEVVITIPATGLGEIAYRDGDRLVKLGARAATGRSIAAGEVVSIERVTNHVAIVHAVDSRPSGSE